MLISVEQTRKRKPEIYLNERRGFREVTSAWKMKRYLAPEVMTLFNGAL